MENQKPQPQSEAPDQLMALRLSTINQVLAILSQLPYNQVSKTIDKVKAEVRPLPGSPEMPSVAPVVPPIEEISK